MTNEVEIDLERIQQEINEYLLELKRGNYWEASKIGMSLNYWADTYRHIQNGTL